jgi:hypothetical protein
VISLVIAIALLPDFVASAWLVAVTCAVAGDGRSIGAVNTPAAVTVPTAAFPPATPLTLQLTAVSVAFTVAVNVIWLPSRIVPLVGVTLTTMDGGGGGGG